MGGGGRNEQKVEDEVGEKWVLRGFRGGRGQGVFWGSRDLEEVVFYQFCFLGLQDDKDLQVLLKGGQFLKVKFSLWRRERFYKLQEDCKIIWQEFRKVMRISEFQMCEYFGVVGQEVECGICVWMGKLILVRVGGYLWIRIIEREIEVQFGGVQVSYVIRIRCGEIEVVQSWGEELLKLLIGKVSFSLGWRGQLWIKDYRWRC